MPFYTSFRSFADVARYSYSPKELASKLLYNDGRRFGLSAGRIHAALASYSDVFFRTNGAITSLHSRPIRGKNIFSLHSLRDHLYIRRTDEILRRSLNISRPDRNNEVRQLIAVLSSEPQYSILRTDVSAFFESIRFRGLINKLEAEGFRNHSTLAHLKSINAHLESRYNYQGLPRGLSISSTLADYSLQHIDRVLFARSETIYYTRYVDDICIVHNSDNETLFKFLTDLLSATGLTVNNEKTLLLDPPYPKPLEYLGYSIKLDASRDVSIAIGKIAKAKRRLIRTLQVFVDDRRALAFVDLRDRLRFLTSNVELRKPDRAESIFTGFRHNYKECTKNVILSQLNDLDSFLRGILKSRRYKLGRRVRDKLSVDEFRYLERISFEAGYTNNITAHFKPDRIAALTDAWRYE